MANSAVAQLKSDVLALLNDLFDHKLDHKSIKTNIIRLCAEANIEKIVCGEHTIKIVGNRLQIDNDIEYAEPNDISAVDA
jgi:hypothetical protein